MTATFTQELVFGPWAVGVLTDGLTSYRTIQATSSGPSPVIELLTGQDIFLGAYGQSNVGSQGTAGFTPAAAAQALLGNPNVRIWLSGPTGSGASWQPYNCGVTSNPIQNYGSKATTSVTWLAGTVTVIAAAHGLSTGFAVFIQGVTPTAYNGVAFVTVIDANTFTYALASNPGVVTVQGTANVVQYWGREAQFLINYLTKYPTARVDIFKYGPGGAQLYDDNTVATLLPGATVSSTKHWPTFTSWYATAVAAGLAVRAGYTTIFEFDQGETDSQNATKAAAYAANGQILIDGINSVFNPDYIVINQIFGTNTGNPVTLTNNYPNCDAVRAGHASMAAYAGAKGILIDDAPAWTTANGSSVHYPPSSIDGVAGTGARFYAQFVLPDTTTSGSISGTAQVGQTLTYTPAVWNYTPTSVAYQWKAAGSLVQTGGLTYSPTGSDVGKSITVTEVPTAPLGAGPGVTCTGTSAVAAAPAENASTTALVNAAVAAGGSAPDSTRRSAVDVLISGLKSDIGNAGDSSTVWSHITAMEIIAGHDEIFSQMEWKGATKKIAAFGGSPAFVTDRGYTLNGTSQSLTTGLNPTTLAIATNQVGLFLWIAAGSSVSAALGVNGAVAQRFGFNKVSAISLQCNASAAVNRSATGAPARNSFHYMQRPNSASVIDYYVNGALDTAGLSSTAGGGQNTNVLLGQNSTTPNYSAERYFVFGFTDGLLDAAGVSNFYNRLATYKTTLGA